MQTELEKREILRLSNEESNRITKECLRIAMIKLMDKKDFDKISIPEITKNAGVSRTAFYRNYETREALVEDICHILFTELKTSVSGELYRTDRKKWYTVFFKTIKENSEYFQIYLNAHLQFGEMFILESVYPPATAFERYEIAAREGSFLRLLTVWFTGGMKESPEEMGEICEELIHNALKTYRERSALNEDAKPNSAITPVPAV